MIAVAICVVFGIGLFVLSCCVDWSWSSEASIIFRFGNSDKNYARDQTGGKRPELSLYPVLSSTGQQHSAVESS
jgi:hypothetical protein